jgi:hypothetical protein
LLAMAADKANIDFACHIAIASKPAPTGSVVHSFWS